jgi:hypothetical protein
MYTPTLRSRTYSSTTDAEKKAEQTVEKAEGQASEILKKMETLESTVKDLKVSDLCMPLPIVQSTQQTDVLSVHSFRATVSPLLLAEPTDLR